MRVNSAFTGYSTNRLVVWSRFAIVMLAIFFTASSFTEHSSRTLRSKQVNLVIRQIGDRLLLQAGDSTSRVMPVTEMKEGTFLLRFEHDFVFSHDSLMVLTLALLPKTQFPSGYMVTVHDCLKDDIVYGFQVSNTSPDILACKGRIQPAGCYTIEYTFPDFYDNLNQKKTGISQPSGSANFYPEAVSRKPEELKTTSFDLSNDKENSVLKSDDVHSPKVITKPGKSSASIFGFPLINVVCVGLLTLLSVALLIRRFRKISTPVTGQHQNFAIAKESIPEGAALGEFWFNVKDQRLVLNSEVISLTDKECKVLELLHKNFGELLPRETLMQEVWINEGVITGRSLDMFISKLRKKLSVDPDLRITNIHGKGYRLETVNDAISNA